MVWMSQFHKASNEQVYAYLKQYYQEYGLMPKYETIAQYLNLAGRDSVQYHIKKLRQKGLLDKNNMFTDKKAISDCIKVIGDVAAGIPIESSDIVDEVALKDILNAHHTFWLRIKGDSMYEAGINDGDYVQIKKVTNQDEVNNKDIVVAEVQKQYECTLKEYHLDSVTGEIKLTPKNPSLKPISYAATEVRVLGKYTGIVIQNQYFKKK